MKEIGSEFESEPEFLNNSKISWEKFFPRKNRIFLSTGRDSIIYAIKAFQLKKILIPSYIEELVLNEILNAGIKVEFYKINGDLTPDFDDIKKKLGGSDSLLLIHYFGFIQPTHKIKSLCSENKLILIEDCVQSMLSNIDGIPIGSLGDISFNSLRKFVGIPDGSIVSTRKKIILFSSKIHDEFIKKRINALNGKHRYLKGDKKYTRYYFKKAFLEADKIISKYHKPAPMSLESLKILKQLDFSKIINIRRKNFEYLLSTIHHLAFFTKLPTNICPLGFPIILKNRNQILDMLVKNKIYSPIHWPLPKKVNKTEFKTSWQISDQILTIPIDQRYSIGDMERIAKILNHL